MKKLVYIGGLLVLLAFIVGAAIIVPRVTRMIHGTSGGVVGWDASDDLTGVAQFESSHRAAFITRFKRDKEEFFRLGILDLGSGQVVSQKVFDDRGVGYIGQSDHVAWITGTSDGLRAIDESGGIAIGEKALLKKDPQLGKGSLLTRFDEGAYVDATSGGLFLPHSGPGFLVDSKTFDAKAATPTDLQRQPVTGTLPIAKLSTGELLTPTGGAYFGVNGKQVVTDVHARMYQMKYLISSRSGTLIELADPKSVLVLSDDWDNANPRVRVSRVALDGRVLWTTEVRDVVSLHKEQLKVVSTGLDQNNVVLFINDYYAAAKYQPPLFTPFYVMAINLKGGRVVYKTHL